MGQHSDCCRGPELSVTQEERLREGRGLGQYFGGRTEPWEPGYVVRQQAEMRDQERHGESGKAFVGGLHGNGAALACGLWALGSALGSGGTGRLWQRWV